MTKRKALIVGIDDYEHVSRLHGCVRDAHSVQKVLEYHGTEQRNFDCKLLAGIRVSRRELKDQLAELFRDKVEVALFYFAGHGHIEGTGGYLVTSECEYGDAGLSLHELVTMANASKADNTVILLDSCHAGIAAASADQPDIAKLRVGLTVLTASTAEQYATEINGQGVFTGLLVSALEGGAANLTGDISPSSVYAYVDQSLGSWGQRPMFKANVESFVSLRQVEPPISLANLKRIVELFPNKVDLYHLDPEHEPEWRGRDPGMPAPVPEKTKKFLVLQQYNRLHLVVPVVPPGVTSSMWHAAMGEHDCKLTALGQHYHRLVADKRI